VQPIQEVELWDLVSAFGRVLRDNRTVQPSNIVYDETPIQVYMQRIVRVLVERHRVAFSDLFTPGMHKSAMIGMFLAVLELVRYHGLQTEQEELHGEIWLYFQQPPAEWTIAATADDSDRRVATTSTSPLEPRSAGA
jgi:segregation and condensation protein A